jgi:hypothetical protein
MEQDAAGDDQPSKLKLIVILGKCDRRVATTALGL